MKNVLITGGAGFIGSSLAEALLLKGYNVMIFDNFSKGTRANIDNCLVFSNCSIIEGDLLDSRSLSKVVSKSDIVFHLAANPDVRIGASNTEVDYQQNILATYYLLEAMRTSQTCKKVVFTSSSTVYGEPELIPTPETYGPLKPISMYGSSKLACESIISGYCHMFNMSGIVFRLANIVGPRSTHGIVYDFINKLSKRKDQLEILGNGRQNKSYVYIEDCINAILYALQIDSTFEIFNVGSTDRITVLDIAESLLQILGLSNTVFNFQEGLEGRGWKGDVKEMLLDCKKIASIGWQPTYSSHSAIELTAQGMLTILQNTNLVKFDK